MADNHKGLLVTYHHYQFGIATYKTEFVVFYRLLLRPELESHHSGLLLEIEVLFVDVQSLDTDNPASSG